MRWLRLFLLLAGTAIVLYGMSGLLTAKMGPRPRPYLEFAVTGLFGHDLLLAPAGLAAGVLLARLAPARWRGLLRGALLASAAVTLIALPFLLGDGRRPTNPSALPLDYPRGLAIALGALWLGTAAVAAIRLIRARRRPH